MMFYDKQGVDNRAHQIAQHIYFYVSEQNRSNYVHLRGVNRIAYWILIGAKEQLGEEFE